MRLLRTLLIIWGVAAGASEPRSAAPRSLILLLTLLRGVSLYHVGMPSCTGASDSVRIRVMRSQNENSRGKEERPINDVSEGMEVTSPSLAVKTMQLSRRHNNTDPACTGLRGVGMI